MYMYMYVSVHDILILLIRSDLWRSCLPYLVPLSSCLFVSLSVFWVPLPKKTVCVTSVTIF